MYAIIDIETTGGQPHQDAITEIAIFLHDGEKVTEHFHSLINPERSIPYFITQLTGITDEMVQDAPKFYEVARQIVEFTEGRIFVAHNARFDYSFIKKQFNDLGYNYQRKTLCTVRLSRSLLPGQPSFSLGKLCKNLNIELVDRHRAIGDAAATAKLFDMLLKADQKEVTQAAVGLEVKAGTLPPRLTKDDINNLPEATGVYYMHNEQGEVTYVGKSKNIKKRIIQHLNIDYKSRKSLDFKNSIASISYELTGSELVALLFESHEIKRLKPLYNRKLRRNVYHSGIFLMEDEQGYKRLYYDKLSNGQMPLIALANHVKAKAFLFHKVAKHSLCQKLCDLYKTPHSCFDYQVQQCKGACIGKEAPEEYNQRVDEAISSFTYDQSNLVVIGKGRDRHERSVVMLENGRFIGFGYIDEIFSASSFDDFKQVITRYKDNQDAQQIIRGYLRQTHGDKLLQF